MFKSSSSRAGQTHAVIVQDLCKQTESQTEDRGMAGSSRPCAGEEQQGDEPFYVDTTHV